MTLMSERAFTLPTTEPIHGIPDVFVWKLQDMLPITIETVQKNRDPGTILSFWPPSDNLLLLNIVTAFLLPFLFPLNLSPNQPSPSCCIAANEH